MVERKAIVKGYIPPGPEGWCGTSHPSDRTHVMPGDNSRKLSQEVLKKSLEIELASIETMLVTIDEQQLRSVTPFVTPKHIAKDKEVLGMRVEFIREQLNIGPEDNTKI